jgi:hypothetical protein
MFVRKIIWPALAIGLAFALVPAAGQAAEPQIRVLHGDQPISDGAVVENINDLLITGATPDGANVSLQGTLSADQIQPLNMTRISLPLPDRLYLSLPEGQANFRIVEDNCSDKMLSPKNGDGSTCDVTLIPRATEAGIFMGKLNIEAGDFRKSVPLFGQARNFCEPEPAIVSTSSCSAQCGGGTITTIFNDGCGNTWSDSQPCNEQACGAYNWNTSAWTECSALCGGGLQLRDVWCERLSDGARVADNFCQEDIKPAGSQPCNQMTCYRDYKSCGWMPDIPVELAYRGYLLQVQDEDNPDAYRNVSFSCAPDNSQSTPIDKRVLGCENVHYDNRQDQISYGAGRWFVTETDEALTGCLEDRSVVFDWVPVPVGWDNRDEDLVAYRTRRFEIEVNGKAIPMTDPAVPADEQPVAYVLASTETLGTGETYQEVCMVYENTYLEETWTRPDTSSHVRNAGPGEPKYVSGNNLHMEAGKCVPNTRTVPIANGSQSQQWNGSQWVIAAVSCNSGYSRSGNSCVRARGSWVATGWGNSRIPHCYYDTGHSDHWYASPSKACYVGEQCFVLQVEPRSDEDQPREFTCR